MAIVTRIAAAVQSLLGPRAEGVAQQVPVVRRRRKFSPGTLAQAFVLGFLAKPRASDEDLARTAALCGVAVTTQAVGQRFTAALAEFLQALFARAVRQAVQAERAPAPPVERFAAVILRDGATITLPDALRERFPGCGGSYGGGQAAMKLQVQLDLRGGALTAVSIEAGKGCDQRAPSQSAPLPERGLRIADLGYFDTKALQKVRHEKGFWISRLAFGTELLTPEGQPIARIEDLFEPARRAVDRPVLLGEQAELPCRIVAWRAPTEVANRRRQKLIATAREKGGPPPSRGRLAWGNWTVFVTNVPGDLLTPEEVAVLYRARWQIELMFERWKSLGRVADLRGSTAVRQLVGLWSRLLAVLVRHWLLRGCAWGDGRCSRYKACQAIRDLASHLATAAGDRERLLHEIERLRELFRKLARRDQRKRPGTFELLNDPSLLGYES
jgi:hypothetical protein